MVHPIRARPALLLALLFSACIPWAHAQASGEAVRIEGTRTDDVYAAGATVDSSATVEGDLVAAGARVSVTGPVGGDAMVAGGSVQIRAGIGDDARLAGGEVVVDAPVGDDAIAAGGSVTLTRAARVGGRAWLSGGRIDVAGTVGRELRAAGGEILLSGRIRGDARLAGGEVRVLDGAVIEGDLIYRSPEEAHIAPGAEVRGSITHEPIERPVAGLVAAAAGALVVVLLGLVLTGAGFFLLFPGLLERAAAGVRAEPLKTLGLGLALFAATPVAIGLLFALVIGWLPALVIGALYPILLLAGFLVGAYFIGTLLRGRRADARVPRFWPFALGLVLLTLLGLIPLVGALALFVLVLLGMGALSLELYRDYAGTARATSR